MAKKGEKHSEETKQKMREARLNSPHAFKSGHTPWNKGVPQSEEHRQKNSESHLGQIAWNKGISSPSPMEGKKHTPETREKMSQAATGRIPWNKGLVGAQTAWNKGQEGCYSEDTIKKMSKAKIGDKSPTWKGGICYENQRIRTLPKFQNWRIAVFARDGYKCQGPGPHARKLHAHHILPFSEYPEARLLVANGQTLCKDCHRKLHKEIY